jgi:hypothetical protein
MAVVYYEGGLLGVLKGLWGWGSVADLIVGWF